MNAKAPSERLAAANNTRGLRMIESFPNMVVQQLRSDDSAAHPVNERLLKLAKNAPSWSKKF